MEIGKASRGKLRIHDLGPLLESTFLLVNGLTIEVKSINEQQSHHPTKNLLQFGVLEEEPSQMR